MSRGIVLFQLELAAIESNHLREIGNSKLLDDRAVILENVDRGVVRPGRQSAPQLRGVADRAQRKTVARLEKRAVLIHSDRQLHFSSLIVFKRIRPQFLSYLFRLRRRVGGGG